MLGAPSRLLAMGKHRRVRYGKQHRGHLVERPLTRVTAGARVRVDDLRPGPGRDAGEPAQVLLADLTSLAARIEHLHPGAIFRRDRRGPRCRSRLASTAHGDALSDARLTP